MLAFSRYFDEMAPLTRAQRRETVIAAGLGITLAVMATRNIRWREHLAIVYGLIFAYAVDTRLNCGGYHGPGLWHGAYGGPWFE